MVEKQEPRQSLQVIHAGLFRTSTRSMAEAYRILGYKTHHALDNTRVTPWAALEKAAEATWPGTCGSRPRAMLKREDWDTIWAGWDIATDVASPFAPQLIEIYPDAKVVVMQREFDSWWPSFDSECVEPQFMRFGTVLFLLGRHLLGFHAAYTMRKTILGMFDATNRQEIEDHARDTYEEYYRRVRQMVPPERRLEYKIGSGWGPLCAFLGKEVPDVPFPQVNDRESHSTDTAARLSKGIKRLTKVVLKWGVGVGIAITIWHLLDI